MINKIIEWYTNSGVVQFFFWGPVIINGIFYPIHAWFRVQHDRRKMAENQGKVYDAVTVGDLFKFLFATIVPVVNALCTIFHVCPIAWDYISKKFAWLFKRRLVDWKSND